MGKKLGWAMICCWGLFGTTLSWAVDETVSGNLTVTGIGDVQGNTFEVGTVSATSNPALSFNFVDGTSNQIQLGAPGATTSWLWYYQGTSSAVPQMLLDTSNVLTIYDRASTPNAAIQLNPGGASLFTGSLTVNGTDNRLPNQTLADPTSILTESLADGRYVKSASFAVGLITDPTYGSGVSYGLSGGTGAAYDSFAGINATANGAYSIALGASSYTTNEGTAALGYGSAATGYHSVAVGPQSDAYGGSALAIGAFSEAGGDFGETFGAYSVASEFGTIALGYNSTASGYRAVAIGVQSTASGANSVTLGEAAVSSGDYSVAAGYQTTSQGSYQLVAGRFNAPQGTGDGSTWVSTDDLFQIGNGSDDTHRSNAFTVNKSGDTSIGGSLTVAGAIYVAPQGDLSMGSFTAGP